MKGLFLLLFHSPQDDDYKGFFPRKKVKGEQNFFSPNRFLAVSETDTFQQLPFSTSPAIGRSLFHLHLVPSADVASRLTDQG